MFITMFPAPGTQAVPGTEKALGKSLLNKKNKRTAVTQGVDRCPDAGEGKPCHLCEAEW